MSFANFLRKTGPMLVGGGVVLGDALAVTRLVRSRGQASEPARWWYATAQDLLDASFDGFATRVRVQPVRPAGPAGPAQ